MFALLRSFHAMLAGEVDAHGGTLDKFTGDGIMATFGTPVAGPRDAANALDCARAIGVAMARANAARLAAGEPKIRIGVGLHWGEAMMGTIGDERRLEFAVLGDTVNVASRLEGLAHRLSAQVCASAEVVEAARRQGAALDGFLDSGAHALRGRPEPVEVWTFSADAEPT
jgi:adenylate cyclase